MDANHDLEAAEHYSEDNRATMETEWIMQHAFMAGAKHGRADERRASEEEVLDAHEATVNAELEAERATTRAEASEERERVLKEAIGNLTCDNCGMLMSDREWSGCIVCQPVRALLIPENAGDA